MTKNCKKCSQQFEITQDDFNFYEKIRVPEPTLCWRCRAMRRMSWRNMTHLYKRKCDFGDEEIFTLLPRDTSMKVYCYDHQISDAWDPLDYGMDYYFNRSFFEQWNELFYSVPWSPQWNFEKINSEYSISAFIKNCYLCFDTGNNTENCAYCVSVQYSKDCFNLINCKKCELCYWCINTDKSYKVFYSRNCDSCTDSWFLQDCIGCTSCFGCAGLRNKSYYIFNEQYSKKEYETKLHELLNNFTSARSEAIKTWNKYPVKFMHGFQNKNVTGDYIFNSADLRMCFFANGAQNCAYSQSVIYTPVKDSMDVTSFGGSAELGYEVLCAGEQLANVEFANECMTVTDSQYVMNCRNASNLFGCIGLRSKKYCILNKQYSKDEFEKLKAQIIENMKKRGEYGEFFPSSMSPWGYNETQAQDYFPLKKEEAIKLGFNWKNEKKKEVPKEKDVIACSHNQDCDHLCSGGFKMIPSEKQFIERMKLPKPTLCFNCRYKELVSWRNPPALYDRQCAKCGKELQTSYEPDRPEIIYCEQCYLYELD